MAFTSLRRHTRACLRSIMCAAAVGSVLWASTGAALAQAQSWDFGDAEVVNSKDVQLEHYQRTGGDRGPALLSLKPYESSLVKRQHTIQGSVTVTFKGQPGYYTIVTQVQDESDGTSSYQLFVDGKEVDAWKADGIFTTYWRFERTPHVKLKTGSKIKLIGTLNNTEFARVRKISVEPGQPPRETHEAAPKVRNIDYSMNLVRLGDYRDVPEAHELIPHPSDNWGQQGRNDPSHLFAAEMGDRFVAYTGSLSSHHGINTHWRVTGVGDRAEHVVAEGDLEIAPGGKKPISFSVPYTGVFRLKVAGALQQDSHPLIRDVSNFAEGGGYFFVPRGVQAFKVRTTSLGDRDVEIVVKGPTGEIVYRQTHPSHSEVTIPVPAKDAGQAWWITGRGNTAEIMLEGVPPYLALLPADLLVPHEALGRADPDARGDALSDQWHPAIDPQATAGDGPAVTFVTDGKAGASIVVPQGSAAEASEAAQLLQQYVQRITGAKLQIAEQAGKAQAEIWIGTADAAKQARIDLPADFDNVNREGFLLRSSADRLVIVGRTRHALEPAVRTLLMKLGVRWYFPGSMWEIVPEGDTLKVALNEVQAPDLIRRHISYGQRTSTNLMNDFDHWYDANRLGSALDGSIHHSYESFVSRANFKEHPEWFALKDTDGDGIGDTRTPSQPCTTHPEVVKMFQQAALDTLEQHPEMDLLPVSPNDGTGNMCRCERCRAVGSYSDCAWLIAHQVAEAIHDKHPNVLVGFYAYGRTSPPPTIDRPRDERLVADLATAFTWHATLPEMLKGWPPHVGWVGIRDYYAITSWGGNLPDKGAFVHEVAKDIPMYYERNARGISAESCAAWGGSGLPMYVAAQLMWDVHADANALTERFYQDCFGKAAPQAQRYYGAGSAVMR